jgi:hypothetical protein
MQDSQAALIGLVLEKEAGPGYYTFKHWVDLNSVLFRIEQRDFVTELWRIFKIVSAGHDKVSTELVGESLLLLTQFDRPAMEVKAQLEELFVKMFEARFFRLAPGELKDFGFLKRIRTVILDYRTAITCLVEGGKLPTQEMTRFDLMYEYGKAMHYRRSLNAAKKIEEEMEDCTFSPGINHY